jgi:hypothetical protein
VLLNDRQLNPWRQKEAQMRIFIDTLTVRLEVGGQEVTNETTGFVNVYKRADGSLVSGRTLFSTVEKAAHCSGSTDGTLHLGVVSLAAYLQYLRGTINEMKTVAKKYIVNQADQWLAQQCNAQITVKQLAAIEHIDEEDVKKKVVKKKAVKKKPVKKKTKTVKKLV